MLKTQKPNDYYFGIPEYYIPIREFQKYINEFGLVDSLSNSINEFQFKTNPNYPNVRIALFHTAHILVVTNEGLGQVLTGINNL